MIDQTWFPPGSFPESTVRARPSVACHTATWTQQQTVNAPQSTPKALLTK